ncbi:MAG: DUF4350 domain-containing protein [Nocardioides sp.]|uniref:DUF4350 domain-containing protein n=1 Tax=Nocardioides sp. TaxID=35761 RepID=UPI003F06362D
MRRRLGSRSVWLLSLAAVLAVAVAVLLQDPARSTAPLDPDNPGGTGLRALARVLDQTHDVTTARTADSLAETDPDAGTVVVVVQPDQLGPSTVQRLRDDAGDATVVLLDPGQRALGLFHLDTDTLSVGGETLESGCASERWGGLELEVATGTAFPADGCFEGNEGRHVLVERPDGLVLFGAATALSNDQILAAENAAVGLRLLGQGDRVVFYVPDLADLTAEDAASAGPLLPEWIVPGLLLLFFAGMALVLWRGRRFGALAVEPLPVRVRATEAVQSRGRLYQRANDRAHAAQALRGAAVRSARRALGLGRAEPEEVTHAVAARTGRSYEDVHALLVGATPPATDAELTHLAGALAALEKEVRTP